MQPVKVLHFTSHNEPDCGIAKYQKQYLSGMQALVGVTNKVFEVSPYQTRGMSPEELTPVVERLAAEMKDYDILHIQHEFGLYWHDQFKRLVEAGKQAGKKVVVTVHLSPEYAIKPARRGGLSPRNIVGYLRKLRHRQRMIEYHVEPMRQADTVIAHNEITKRSLQNFGVPAERIQKIPHPVYQWPEQPPASTEVKEKLGAKDGDVVCAMIGFLHKKKGVTAAVRMLKYLPDNYKLALLGGVKADSDDVEFEDRVTNLMDEIGVRDRVYITGFVKEDDRLNALIRECEVCIYPYNKTYYANLSSGSINLAIANGKPVVAYPTAAIKEMAGEADGAVVLCETFAYYELARELQRLDIPKQVERSKAYADKNAWPKAAERLVQLYQDTAGA